MSKKLKLKKNSFFSMNGEVFYYSYLEGVMTVFSLVRDKVFSIRVINEEFAITTLSNLIPQLKKYFEGIE